MQNILDFNRERRTFFGAQTTNNLGFFLLVLLGGARDEREEGETLVLMTRVNGLGRLIPTPALSKIMLHLAAGGLGGPPSLKPYIVLLNSMNPQLSLSDCHCPL